MWGRYRAKNLINLIFFRIVSVVVSIIVCVTIVVVIIPPVISICVSIWRRIHTIVLIRIQVNEIKWTKENG